MGCPNGRHKRTRIIRARPDPEIPTTDPVRQRKNLECLAVFTSREAVVSIIENSKDREILKALASRIEALPTDSRDAWSRCSWLADHVFPPDFPAEFRPRASENR